MGQIPENLVSCVKEFRLLSLRASGKHLGVLTGGLRSNLVSVKVSDLHSDCYVENGLKVMSSPDAGMERNGN